MIFLSGRSVLKERMDVQGTEDARIESGKQLANPAARIMIRLFGALCFRDHAYLKLDASMR
jgi:hypothetical protein